MAQPIADLPQTPASVSTVDSVFVGEGMQRADVNNAFRALAAMVKSDFARSANTLTAASVFTLASISTGDYVRMAPYAGQSITSFGPATDGLQKYLESTGTQILRNGASLSVQGGADLTLAAGDVVWCRRDQGVWKVKLHPAAALVRTDAANTFTAAQAITGTGVGSILTLTSTDAGASNGPSITLDRNSASPAVSDILGSLVINGRNSGGSTVGYGEIFPQIDRMSTGAEDSTFFLRTKRGGAAADLKVTGGALLGSGMSDKGLGTANMTGVYVGGHGTIAQAVRVTSATYQTCSTDLPCDNTIPQITEGDELFNVAITPINASSTLLITFTAFVGATTAGQVGAALFVDATGNALNASCVRVNSAAGGAQIGLQHNVSAGSTSARTYRIRLGPDVGGPASAFLNGDNTARIFGGIALASLEVWEILPQ